MSADAAAAAALDAEENVSAKMGEDAAVEEVSRRRPTPRRRTTPTRCPTTTSPRLATSMEHRLRRGGSRVRARPPVFPRKLGGRPAWLDPVDVPTAKQLKCLYTANPRFLLSSTLPWTTNPPRSTARSTSSSARTAATSTDRRRARLPLAAPRENPFYPDEPAEPGGPLQELTDEQQAAYDVRETGGRIPTDVGSVVRRPKMFPEFELAVEPESWKTKTAGVRRQAGSSGKGNSPPRTRTRCPRSFAGRADVSERELRELERMQDKDQVQLSQFHLRLRRGDPTQVVRYCFDEGAKPLWPSVTHAPVADEKTVPPCPRCGAARRFEFQVLPQIINHLEVDSELASAVDFGAIAVYTCSESCAPPAEAKEEGVSAAYAEEIVLVHPPLNA